MESSNWPALTYHEWLDTYETLHLYTQIVGKVKLELAPWLNEWWHVAFAIWARGITTGPIPYSGGLLEIRFDFVSHNVEIQDSRGNTQTVELTSQPVAEFYSQVRSILKHLGIVATITETPQEMPGNSIPLDRDLTHRSYDREAVSRFWTILSRTAGIFERFRSGFSGKATPIQFWWGSFDLAIARFCGIPSSAPPHARRLERISDDECHFAAGFWPGNGSLQQPAFYAYSYPAIPTLQNASILPDAAYWNPDLGEFTLHYEEVRTASAPEQLIMEFLTSTYEAVANAANWDRAFLERKIA